MKGGRGSAAISPAECLFTIPIPGIPGDGRERQFIAPSADVQVLLPDCLEIGFRKPISSAPARGDNEASPLFPRITERRFHVRSFVGDDRRRCPVAALKVMGREPIAIASAWRTREEIFMSAASPALPKPPCAHYR